MKLFNASLEALLSHNIHLILIAIGFIVIILSFLIKKNIKERSFNFITLGCSLWLIFQVYLFPPDISKSNNLKIYTYNANLTLYHQKVYDRKVPENESAILSNYKDPKYLDYTGLQHLIYVLLTSVNFSNSYPRYLSPLVGFQMWTILWLLLAVYLIKFLRKTLNNTNHLFWFLIIFTFHPVFYYFWIFHWEDKITFFVLPLIVLLTTEKKQYATATFLSGIIIGLNGILIFFIIPLMMHIWREKDKRFWIYIFLFCFGFIIAMLPYFPQNLLGWQNRMDRTNIEKPFWFSIYLLLPVGLYSAFLNKITLLILFLISGIGYWKKYLNLRDMLLISVFLVIVIGPYNSIARTVSLIMLFSILTFNSSRIYWIFLSVIMVFYLFLSDVISQSDIQLIHVVIFYIPLLYVITFYIFSRIKENKPDKNHSMSSFLNLAFLSNAGGD